MNRKIKDNKIIRGLYFLFTNYFGCKKSKFGYYGKKVIITPPPHLILEIYPIFI